MEYLVFVSPSHYKDHRVHLSKRVALTAINLLQEDAAAHEENTRESERVKLLIPINNYFTTSFAYLNHYLQC